MFGQIGKEQTLALFNLTGGSASSQDKPPPSLLPFCAVLCRGNAR